VGRAACSSVKVESVQAHALCSLIISTRRAAELFTWSRLRQALRGRALATTSAAHACAPVTLCALRAWRQNAGDPYAEIEVMKMFMPVVVKEAGMVHWCLSEGAALKPGDRLATLELDDPSSVNKVSDSCQRHI
jgi:Biotin-requiring enzyme